MLCMDRDDEEHPEFNASELTHTSTSHTLIISEGPKTTLETSDSPRSPRVSKKKPKTGAAGKGIVATGDLSTPLHDDVSIFFAFISLFYSRHTISYTSFVLQLFCSP